MKTPKGDSEAARVPQQLPALPARALRTRCHRTGRQKKHLSSMKVIKAASDSVTEAMLSYLYPFRHFSFADIK